MAFKQKQKEDQKAMDAMKAKASGKGPLGIFFFFIFQVFFKWSAECKRYKPALVLRLQCQRIFFKNAQCRALGKTAHTSSSGGNCLNAKCCLQSFESVNLLRFFFFSIFVIVMFE